MEAQVSKACFKCGETKPLSDFYKHPMMADGHVNKCKECNKLDVRKNRKDKVEYYRAYDIERGSRHTYERTVKYREENPKKYAAHTLVGNAVRSGKIVRQNCEVCGREDAHAHHCDYDEPLDVMWLCPVHHVEWHQKHGEALNAH